MPDEQDECCALLAADDAAAVEDDCEEWDSVCSRTLHALRSIMLKADGASQEEDGQTIQQEVARSAAHAMLRLDSAR